MVAIKKTACTPKHSAKKGDIYQGQDGVGVVEYVNKIGGVTLKIQGRSIHISLGEFIEGYEEVVL